MPHDVRLAAGDTVIVLSGKDKGKRGTVSEVRPKERRVVVGGVNQMKRHVRPRARGRRINPNPGNEMIHRTRSRIDGNACHRAPIHAIRRSAVY